MPSDEAKKPTTPASYAEFEHVPGQGGWLRTVVQFFAIPLLIVCVAVGLYLGITLMVGAGPRDAADFVSLLQSDTINRRWQAAYELADRLHGREVPPEFKDPRLVAALCSTLERARAEREEPPRLATLVLGILGRLQSPESLDAVRAALDDRHAWVRSYAVRTLGDLRDEASRARLEKLAHHDDPGTRQASLDALAKLDQVDGLPFRLSPRTRTLAREHLGDTVHEDVRFTAALILADAGERKGTVRVLLQMLDRRELERFTFDDKIGGINRYQIHSNVLLRAIAAVTKLRCGDDPLVLEALRRLTDDEHEGDAQVREAARQALRTLSPAD